MHMLEQHQGKDHVSAQDQADENMAGSGSGVYLAEYKGEYMEVSMESANQLTVSAGALWVNGRFCIVDPAETLTVDNGSSGMTEYDLVCVHWKETTATQQVALAEGGTKEVSTTVEETELVIVKGDPASSGATDPEISQTTIRAGVGEAWVPFARITKDGLTPSVAFIVDKLVPESKFRTSIVQVEEVTVNENISPKSQVYILIPAKAGYEIFSCVLKITEATGLANALLLSQPMSSNGNLFTRIYNTTDNTVGLNGTVVCYYIKL